MVKSPRLTRQLCCKMRILRTAGYRALRPEGPLVARELTIDGVRVADDTDSYVIAEVGHNHQGDLQKCKDIFRAAKEAGATAVKLQKRDNRTLFTQSMYDSAYNSENAYGKTYG